MHWQNFIVALCFLTRIPVPQNVLSKAYERDVSGSVVYYPLVGLVISIILLAAIYVLPEHFPTYLTASIILCVWVAVTGALHLDGFADCVDGFYAAHKSPEKALQVFQDPSVGSMAVMFSCLLLVLKWSLIAALLSSSDSLSSRLASEGLVSEGLISEGLISEGLLPEFIGDYGAFVVAPIVARCLVFFYMRYTPYVRKDGVASTFSLNTFDVPMMVWAGGILFVLALSFSFFFAIVLLLCSTGLTYVWRALWLNKISGYTGDCAGALIEMSEVLTLLIFAWFCLA